LRWKQRLFLLAAAALAVAACGEESAPVPQRPSPTPEVAGTPRAPSRTVEDQVGRTVALTETVERVSALSPGAADFARVLGLEAVTRSSDTPEAWAPGSKVAGTTLSPDFNAIAAAEPDLVLGDANYHSGRTRDFDRFVYPVFVLKANSYGEVLAALAALGRATQREDEAEAAATQLREDRDRAVAAARTSGGSPKVLILTGGGRDVFAGGRESYLGSLVEELGATNVLGSVAEGGPVAGFGVVEVSQAASFAPDVVLVLSSGQGGLVAQIMADPAWAATPAVRNARVVELDNNLYLRAPGPRAGEALGALVEVLWR
jgi:iron complex transport system substrate-binding protein